MPRLRVPDVFLSPLIAAFFALGYLFQLCADPFCIGREAGRNLLDKITDRAFEPKAKP